VRVKRIKMKSLINRTIRLARSVIVGVFLSVVFAAVVSPDLACATDTVWSLDSKTSTASFFLGSAENPNSVNVGVARVAGEVKLETNDLNSLVFDLSIYPADEDWGSGLTSKGNLPDDYVPDTSDHTMLTFNSRHVWKAADGKLKVSGDLMLTRVERNITADATEAYAGPVYGDPVIQTVIKEVTFAFPKLNTEITSVSVAPGIREKQSALELSASTRVAHEDFKGLSDAMIETNWPSVVNNENCQVPSAGEDFHGAICTGTVIAAISADNCHLPNTVGEDYSGLICAPPAGDQTTIVLNLKLTDAMSDSQLRLCRLTAPVNNGRPARSFRFEHLSRSQWLISHPMNH
jgi:polyisoprenoid-binding protein YceI